MTRSPMPFEEAWCSSSTSPSRTRTDASRVLSDDLLRRLVAGREIRVRHARHRRVAETLPSSRPGTALSGELRVQVIVEVPLEHAVLDQHLALAGIAFVVDVDGAAAAGNSAVVDDGDELAGHIFPELSGEERRAFADEVGLEPVPDGFVEEDSAPSWRQPHRPRSRGRRHRAERRHGLPRRLTPDLLRGKILEEAEVDPAAAAVEAGAALALLSEGDALHGEPAEVLPILGEMAQSVGDEDLARRGDVGARD